MNTYVNFANPNQVTSNRVVTQAYPETGQSPEFTTLALGEEGGTYPGNYPDLIKPEFTTLALGEEGGIVTTKALGEEGGGSDPPTPRPQPPNDNGFDQRTLDFIGFFRDADTLQGRVGGDGSLTQGEATNQLNVYAQQLRTLKTLQALMQALDLGSNNRVQTVYDQLFNRFEAGSKLSSFFNLFARPTGPANTVEASDIQNVAFRDGERRNVSLTDLFLSLLY